MKLLFYWEMTKHLWRCVRAGYRGGLAGASAVFLPDRPHRFNFLRGRRSRL